MPPTKNKYLLIEKIYIKKKPTKNKYKTNGIIKTINGYTREIQKRWFFKIKNNLENIEKIQQLNGHNKYTGPCDEEPAEITEKTEEEKRNTVETRIYGLPEGATIEFILAKEKKEKTRKKYIISEIKIPLLNAQSGGVSIIHSSKNIETINIYK